MEWLEWALSPIILAMRFLLNALYSATGSYGFSIILLSCTVRLGLSPISGSLLGQRNGPPRSNGRWSRS